MLIFGLFLKLLSWRYADILKKFNFCFILFQKNGKKKTSKSQRLAKKMCLSGVNLDVLTFELI
jgi:hypothetical protein